ncbi:extracellular calcium-sensing receptor-like [Hyperolius riggenbachi]|uniref:extracellular calcium-sensing receptor-like n=1 Tax=Hyperolius riggenbachi TaxID=752182 RepID=UPI0035A314E1
MTWSITIQEVLARHSARVSPVMKSPAGLGEEPGGCIETSRPTVGRRKPRGLGSRRLPKSPQHGIPTEEPAQHRGHRERRVMAHYDRAFPLLRYSSISYTWLQAMVYATEEINSNNFLLPNISLGFQLFDCCLHMHFSLWQTITALTGQDNPILNYRCNQKIPMAMIADSISLSTISLATLLGLYWYPQIFHHLKHISFTNQMGEEIYFDFNGNPPTDYDILNWKRKADGSIDFVKVGYYNLHESQKDSLSINISAVSWITGGKQIPASMCSESCRPGFRKAAKKGQPICCYDCIACSEGEISNQTDSSNCFPCSPEMWPNENKTTCTTKTLEFLSYQETLGATLTSAAVLFSITTITVLSIFIKNRNTAIVKANNSGLTYTLLGSLSLSFLCCLLFIGEPLRSTCLLQQGVFGVIFALCISCIFAKTLMVVVAFRATRPGSNMRRWLSPKVPIPCVIICTFIQLFICIYWMSSCPSFPGKDTKTKTGVIVYLCMTRSYILFWCMLGYMAFLACVSFMIAFLARGLPDSFNEAKWITFSMLIFLSVWISFVPAHISTQGKLMVAVEIFAILSSSCGILGCFFFPKCYIILFKPEMNTHQNLLIRGTKPPPKKMA